MNRIGMLKWLDRWLGRAAAAVLPSPKTCPAENIRRILIIRPGGIGDAALLIPAIQIFKDKYPDAKVDVLAEKRNATIFELCPQVNHVFRYDKGDLFSVLKSSYDVVIDTEQWHRLSAVVARLIKSKIKIGYGTNERKKLFTHVVDYSHERYELNSFYDLLKPLGLELDDHCPKKFLNVPDDQKRLVEDLITPLASKPYVTLFPGASIAERRWGIENFQKLASKLGESGFPVVVIGGKEDREAGERIVAEVNGLNLAGETSLLGSAAVIENTALLVSGDSGMLHVAVGLDVPTVSLFGSGIADKWAPQGDRHIVLNRNLPCSPCTRFGYTPPCPIDVKCLADIPVEDAYTAAAKLLGNKTL